MNCFKQKDIKSFLADNTKKNKDTFRFQLRANQLADCYKTWWNYEYGNHAPFKDVGNKEFYKALRKAGVLGVYRKGELHFVGLLYEFKKHVTYYKSNIK